jgi:hypothetical protein
MLCDNEVQCSRARSRKPRPIASIALKQGSPIEDQHKNTR